MQVNIHTIKLGIWRSLLRTMPLILMGALTLVTFWLVKKNTPSELSSPERIRTHEPDYTLVNGTVSALNEAGTTKYRLLGRKIIHYDDDASIDIDEPRMRLFQALKAPVTVRAKTGHLDGDLSILDLFGNAEIFRPAQAATSSQAASPSMLALSSYFQALINDDILKTDKPITLMQGLSVMNATDGGIYNNVEQSMTLLGKVRGRIERAQQGSQRDTQSE